MFSKKLNLVITLLVISILFLISCVTDDGKATYTIEGRLIDGTNPENKFANRKLKFQDEQYHKDIRILGEATTNSNGYFKLSYEFDKNYQINFMRIVIDSNFLGAHKLSYLPIGSNWYKDFYVGERALIDLYINAPLGETDTLFFNAPGSIFTIVGPLPAGYVNRFNCINSNQNGIIAYGLGYKNFISQTRKNMPYDPTGEPMVDELHLDLIN